MQKLRHTSCLLPRRRPWSRRWHRERKNSASFHHGCGMLRKRSAKIPAKSSNKGWSEASHRRREFGRHESRERGGVKVAPKRNQIKTAEFGMNHAKKANAAAWD